MYVYMSWRVINSVGRLRSWRNNVQNGSTVLQYAYCVVIFMFHTCRSATAPQRQKFRNFLPSVYPLPPPPRIAVIIMTLRITRTYLYTYVCIYVTIIVRRLLLFDVNRGEAKSQFNAEETKGTKVHLVHKIKRPLRPIRHFRFKDFDIENSNSVSLNRCACVEVVALQYAVYPRLCECVVNDLFSVQPFIALNRPVTTNISVWIQIL